MPDIRHAIQISASADAIRKLVSTPRGLAEWWAADVREKDGAVELGFFNRQTVYRLKLERNDAARVNWACDSGKEWAGTHIGFQLEPKSSDTLVRFTHAGWASETDYFTSCNTTWGELMFRLKGAAEGKAVGPLFLANSLAY